MNIKRLYAVTYSGSPSHYTKLLIKNIIYSHFGHVVNTWAHKDGSNKVIFRGHKDEYSLIQEMVNYHLPKIRGMDSQRVMEYMFNKGILVAGNVDLLPIIEPQGGFAIKELVKLPSYAFN